MVRGGLLWATVVLLGDAPPPALAAGLPRGPRHLRRRLLAGDDYDPTRPEVQAQAEAEAEALGLAAAAPVEAHQGDLYSGPSLAQPSRLAAKRTSRLPARRPDLTYAPAWAYRQSDPQVSKSVAALSRGKSQRTTVLSFVVVVRCLFRRAPSLFLSL